MTATAIETLKASDFATYAYGIAREIDGDVIEGTQTEWFSTMEEAECQARHANANMGGAWNEDTGERVYQGKWFAYKV